MCQWNTLAPIYVIRRNNDDIQDGWHQVHVDACIADYVQKMNDVGIVTVGSCCGHGKSPATVLVARESIRRMYELGYDYHEYQPEWSSVEHDIPWQDGMLPIGESTVRNSDSI